MRDEKFRELRELYSLSVEVIAELREANAKFRDTTCGYCDFNRSLSAERDALKAQLTAARKREEELAEALKSLAKACEENMHLHTSDWINNVLAKHRAESSDGEG